MMYTSMHCIIIHVHLLLKLSQGTIIKYCTWGCWWQCYIWRIKGATSRREQFYIMYAIHIIDVVCTMSSLEQKCTLNPKNAQNGLEY